MPDAEQNTNVVTSGAAGTTFPIGTVEVTATVTDAAGNTATCTFNVVVADTVVPVITACAAQNGTDVVVAINGANVNAIQATNANGAVATWSAATSTDDANAVSSTVYTADVPDAVGEDNVVTSASTRFQFTITTETNTKHNLISSSRSTTTLEDATSTDRPVG